MTYTKKQRNEIYRKALNVLRSYGRLAGLCYSLREVSRERYDKQREKFQEFALFKPETNEGWVGYWWHSRDFDSRETALLFMIAMTE
jgi:hypothetical protein